MFLPLIFLAFLYIQPTLSISNNSFIFGYSINDDNQLTKNQHNLYHLLGSLSSQTKITRFSNFTTSSLKTKNQLHGIYLCRGDTDPQTCQNCINTARKSILDDYPNRREALVWYKHCMLRYSNESFLGKFDKTMWTASAALKKVSGNRIKFMNILRRTLKGLATQASNGRNGNKFTSAFVEIAMAEGLIKLDAMAQCTPDLVPSDCYRCLAYASQKVLHMSNGSTSVRVFYKNCFVQYETTNSFGKNEVESLPILPSPFTNKTLFQLRVQIKPIPFSNNSNPNMPITNSTRFCFKVQFEIPPFSNDTVNSSSNSPSWALANSSSIPPSWKVELKELNVDVDDAESSERPNERATA